MVDSGLMEAPVPLTAGGPPHVALGSDLEHAALLQEPALLPAHLAREHQRVKTVLAGDGFGLCTPSALTLVRPLPWDSEHFGFACADLVRVYVSAPPGAGSSEEQEAELTGLLAQTVAACRERGIVLLSARPKASLVQVVRLLSQQGLELVDTSVELGRPLPLLPTPPCPGVLVRAPAPSDLVELRRIAASFVDNRFHRDPRLPRDLATGVYTRWVEAAARGEHGGLWAAEARGRVAGFATYELPSADDPLPVGALALLVVHPELRGRRVADQLVAACAACVTRAGGQALVTSTQVSNAPALRTFARHGLLPRGARHIMHGWLQLEDRPAQAGRWQAGAKER